MPRLTFRTAYWQDIPARRAFKDFILEIHGVDFDAWDDAGYWDDDYRPYSYFEDGRVVASLCIYTMPAIVGGEACTVAQVSGVGTLPGYRLRGLNRRLHEIALAQSLPRHRFAFLFADDEAVAFYRKCGFRPVSVYAAVLPVPRAAPDPGIEKLDASDRAVRESIYRLACARAPLSHAFSTMNPKLVMYHLLYRFRDHAWRIPALGAVVFMKHEAGRTVVYDILAPEMPRLEALAPFLAAGGARELELRFPVDRLDARGWQPRVLEGHNVHVMGDFDLGPYPVLPFTSQA